MLADLVIVPETAADWALWGFAHRDHHLLIRNAIQVQYNINLQTYDLDPVPFQDPLGLFNWLERNQLAHNDMDTTLGLQGSDLSSVDFSNSSQAQAWVYLHLMEHTAAGNRLQI
jgi:hypothetical protein